MQALEKLEDEYGLSAGIQQRIGALFVYCGMLEFHSEKAIWALTDENPIGKPPSTDRGRAGDLMSKLGKLADRESGNLAVTIRLIGEVAKPLLEYRNAIAHGLLVRFNFEHPSFVNNGTWHGEKRRKPATLAHADADRLNTAIEIADTLSSTAMILFYSCSGPSARTDGSLDQWVAPLQRAQNLVARLRDLFRSCGVGAYDMRWCPKIQ
ncbi:hypothetical protein [Burkholderia sp. 9120]|uniref:hypothetical protein n=1 Tax=Burkholderia sp. 9120 TaxID=1500897 RepID=UPI0012E0135F|nr:hypothetical protein [Burkholderia sp. 9120]